MYFDLATRQEIDLNSSIHYRVHGVEICSSDPLLYKILYFLASGTIIDKYNVSFSLLTSLRNYFTNPIEDSEASTLIDLDRNGGHYPDSKSLCEGRYVNHHYRIVGKNRERAPCLLYPPTEIRPIL